MRISDWSSDVCSSDLLARPGVALFGVDPGPNAQGLCPVVRLDARVLRIRTIEAGTGVGYGLDHIAPAPQRLATIALGYADRSEEHTSELQSLMRISYAVFCLKKKKIL